MSILTPTPLQQIHHSLLEKKEIEWWIKRDDLNHPHVQGNKWRKLKHNLTEARNSNKKYLLTFGGAFSNHIYATAAAGHLFDFKTIGIIRGEKQLPFNYTLKFAEGMGMQLHFVDRKTYRQKEKLLPNLNLPLEDCYVLPEGGTNNFAMKGCRELGEEILDQVIVEPDYICLSSGTGGSAAGIISTCPGNIQVIAFSALKGNFLEKEIRNFLEEFRQFQTPTYFNSNFQLNTDYHFGGYARHTPALLDFINYFKEEFGIQLDPIYTGKLFFGILDLIKKDYFPKGSKIVAIHTGGVQGIEGFRERFGEVI